MSAPTVQCTDLRCTDGKTWCVGCNGWGVVNPKGRKYRVACKAIPPWSVAHEDCYGTGSRVCGCRPVADMIAELDLDSLDQLTT